MGPDDKLNLPNLTEINILFGTRCNSVFQNNIKSIIFSLSIQIVNKTRIQIKY